MTKHYLKGTFYVVVDPNEAVENEQREPEDGDVSLDEVKEHLKKAVYLGLNDEEHGNPIGMESMEIDYESLQGLTREEKQDLYGEVVQPIEIKGPCFGVEYDLGFPGGSYGTPGRLVYLPYSELDKDLPEEKAVADLFKTVTGHNPVHIVHYDMGQSYTPEGDFWVD